MFFRNFFFILYFFFSFCFAFNSFKVKNVCIRGISLTLNEHVALQVFKKFNCGFTLNVRKASLVIKELHELKFFTYIYLERFRNTLIVNVVENLKVASINSNIVILKKDIINVLRKEYKFSYRSFSFYNLCLFKSSVEKVLRSKFFFTTQLNIFYTINLYNNNIIFYINIRERKKTKIKNTYVKTNYFVKNNDLCVQFGQFKNFSSTLLHFDYGFLSLVELDINTIRLDCYNKGFIFFKVTDLYVNSSLDLNFVCVFVSIDKGNRFFTHTLSLKTNCLEKDFYYFYKNIFNNNLQGFFYSRDTFIYLKNNIHYNLMLKGFFFNTVNLNVFLDEKNNLVNIIFEILCNDRIVIKELRFRGNLVLNDDTLRKDFKLNIDSWCSLKILSSYNNDLIEKKNIFLRRHHFLSKRENYFFKWVDLFYYVDERKKTEIVGDVEYDFIDGLLFKTQANLPKFLGTNIDLNFNFVKNKILKNYNYIMYNPNCFNNNIGFGYKFYFYKKNINAKYTSFKYNLNTYGCNAFIILPYLRNQIRLCVGYDSTTIVCAEKFVLKNVGNFLTYGGSTLIEYYFDFTLKQNYLNKKIFPIYGFLQNLNIHLTLPKSTVNYYKCDYDISFFKPVLYKYIIFNINMNFGFFNTYNYYTALPFYKNYFLGGISYLCGFKDNSVGSIYYNSEVKKRKKCKFYNLGGNLFLTTRLSLIFPNLFYIPKDKFRIFLFLDYGYLNLTQKIYLSNIKYIRNSCKSVGVGILWNSPFGVPLEFSFGVPLHNTEGFKKQIFSIALSK